MDKLTLIQLYIDRCDETVASEKVTDAHKLQNEIVGVFGSEIIGITSQLDNYSFHLDAYQVDFIGDIKLLKQKLMNYAANIQREQEKMAYELEIARLKQPCVSAHAESNPTQTATATANMTMTIEQTIKQIDKIPEGILSSVDKNVLEEYIYSLEGIKAAKNKTKYWEIAKELLKFIADKGVDVAIAALPCIITGLHLL